MRAIVEVNTPMGKYNVTLEVDEKALVEIMGPPAIAIIGKTVNFLGGAVKVTADRAETEPKIMLPPGVGDN